MPRIAVVGSANMDLVVQCDALPRMGETVAGTGFSKHPGGKGANQAVAAGRMAGKGTEVFYVGAVGNDRHGMELMESLSTSKVNLAFCRIVQSAPTGVALITVDLAGNNTIVVEPGANALLTGEHVAQALAAVAPDIVLVQLEVPDDAVYACAGHGRLILDPAPARLLDPEFLAQVDTIAPNESETLTLTGMALVDYGAMQRAAFALREKGVRNVVLTMGANGVYWIDGTEDVWMTPAPNAPVVDTTAAGDALVGALAAFLADGDSFYDALTYAKDCAEISIKRPGAQESMPWRSEFSKYETV